MISRMLLASLARLAAHATEPPRGDVEAALLKAAKFFREQVAVQGTYVWQYSSDLSRRV